ncbi:MAG: A/G-specific adenine glycosylase [Clostridia bacterium]|nr:A/G-specific adenine glycosylase [Clostridia bacterium]
MLATLLLAWYDGHKRVLPFRGTKDPYRIWLSEIMLQQTRTETVGAYYERFLSLFPDVFALARAEEQAVLKAWEGLGYYSRARNLHKAAKVIAEDYQGIFPADLDLLRALPGVGDYTAAAVASIAFDLPAPAMDGNLTRVLSRVHGIRQDVGMPSVKRELLSLGQQDMPHQRCGDFNQALMDLGAMVCTPGTPDCEKCPLRPLCNACAAGDAEDLPVKAAAKAPKEIKTGIAIVTCGARTLLMQRKEALLNGLWVFPMTEEGDTRADVEKRLKSLGIRARFRQKMGEARHVFTHRIWQMQVYHYIADEPQSREGQWADLKMIDALPLPTAVRAARAWACNLLTPRIAPAQKEELPALSAAYAASWQDSHQHHCSPAFVAEHTPLHMEMILRGHLDAGKTVHAIRCAGEIAGVLVLSPKENELVSLYIHPACQGNGLGKAAVAYAVNTLDERRDMRVTLLCDNEKARHIYSQAGFTHVQTIRVLNPDRDIREEDRIRKAKEEKTQ